MDNSPSSQYRRRASYWLRVYVSGGPGYRLQEGIVFESGTRSATRSSARVSEETTYERAAVDSVVSSLNNRQRWAISQLDEGVKLQIGHIMEHFGYSSATAKRDLAGLKSMRLVRFVGSA